MVRYTPGRVQMKTATTGSGPYTLTNPSPTLVGKRTIAEAVADGSYVYGQQVIYAIVDPAAAGNAKQLEVGVGTISAGLVLTVVTVIEKSALLVSGGGWGAGNRDVLISPPHGLHTAFVDLANIFLATQTIDGATPTLQYTSGGDIRLRDLYSTNIGYRQYFNASAVIRAAMELADGSAGLKHYTTGGVLDGHLEVGAGTLQFNDGVAVRKVVRFVGGGVVKMPFYVAAAPTGWTKDTSQNDKAMRVVSGGTGGTSGGSRALSSATVGGTALSTAHLAPHWHSFPISTVNVSTGEGASANLLSGGSTFDTSSTGSGTAHDHALALAYIDLIICSLD